MASIRVDRMDARQGRLPPVCICCGEPAERMVEHRFYYQPTWLIICNLILPAIVRWCLAYSNVDLKVPVCSRHGWRLNLPTFMGYGLAAVLLLLVPVLLFLSIGQYYNALLGLGLLALLLVAVMLPAILVAQLMTPRAYYISDLFVGLTAVSDQFAGVSRRGSGLLGGSTSMGLGAAGGGYGQPQPAYVPAGGTYGYGNQPAGSGAWKVVLIVCGSVLGAVLVAFLVIAAVAMSLRSRGGDGIPVAGVPAEEQERAKIIPASSISSAAPLTPPTSFSPPSIPSIAPSSSFTPPSAGPSLAPPAGSLPPAADAEVSGAAPQSAGDPPAPRGRGPRGRKTPASGFAPPADERPVPPIHALDLRTRKVVYPPNHGPIPDTFELAVGQEVWARQHEGPFWHAAYVAELNGDSVTVRYKGWSDFFNETMSRDMLCIDKSALGAAAKTPPPAASAASDSAGVSGGTEGKLRTWTDVTGKHKVEAVLVKIEDGQVTLRKADGGLTTLPIDKLSEADRKFLGEDGFGK